MDNKQIYQEISKILRSKGYKKLYIETLNPYFKWSFDVFAESANSAIGLEFRKNQTVSDIFLDNVSTVKKFSKKLFIYIVFENKPPTPIIDLLAKNGIGIMLFKQGSLFKIQGSRDFSNKQPKKVHIIKSKPTQDLMKLFFLYPSSPIKEKNHNNEERQCPERNIIFKVVNALTRRHQRLPLKVKILEKDHRFEDNFKKSMTVNINESELFVAVIKEKHRKNVEFEIKHAFKKIDKDYMLIFRKDLPEQNFEKKQIKLIKYIQKKKKKHLPYDSLQDFEDQLYSDLMEIIGIKCKKDKTKSPFSL